MRRLHRVRARLGSEPDPAAELLAITDEDRRYVTSLHDESIPLPSEAAELRPEHPALAALRARYAALDLPVSARSRWDERAVGSFLDVRWFRGETLFVWHYRELPRISRLKYFLFARHIADRDHLGLLSRLDEDGLFGCWTFSYPGWPRVSRDLLQSIGEISFLDRELGIAGRESLAVLDVGAGYGRLAHRMVAALANLRDYCCLDAIPEATFLSGWYLGFRGCRPPARVVALDRLDDELRAGEFDLAVAMHSLSEVPVAAVAWWVDRLAALGVPHLLIVPDDPRELLSREVDGSRRDFRPALEAAGYRLARHEPVIDDPAVRELLALDDHYFLFARA